MTRRGSVQLLSLDRGMFERLVEVPEDQLGAALAAAAIELIASVATLHITDRIEVIDLDEDSAMTKYSAFYMKPERFEHGTRREEPYVSHHVRGPRKLNMTLPEICNRLRGLATP